MLWVYGVMDDEAVVLLPSYHSNKCPVTNSIQHFITSIVLYLYLSPLRWVGTYSCEM